MCVCVCVCVLGQIQEKQRDSCSLKGAIFSADDVFDQMTITDDIGEDVEAKDDAVAHEIAETMDPPVPTSNILCM